MVFRCKPIPRRFIHRTADGHFDESKLCTIMKEATTKCILVGYLPRRKIAGWYMAGFSRNRRFSRVVFKLDTSGGIRALAAPGLKTCVF